MATLENLIIFNQKDDKNVQKAIFTFLEGRKSENTRKSYERDYRDFFQTMRTKKLEDLVEQDLIFNPMQIEMYSNKLSEKYKGKTVNRTMASLKSLYKKLKKFGFDVDPTWFDVERQDEVDSKPHDTLTYDEVCEIIQLVSKTRKGQTKALLVRLAYATAFRKDSLLSLKWDDIIQVDGVNCIKTIGKGNKEDIKKISDSLYNALMEYKKVNNSEKIIDLQKNSVDKMMKFIKDNMNFGTRKITFHSFKKASIDEVNLITQGNMKVLQRHGNHSNMTMTLHYTKDADINDLVIVDTDYKVSFEKLEDMTKEQLLDLIKSADRNTQIKLLQKVV